MFPFFITIISTLIKNKVERLLAERFEKDDLKDCFLVDMGFNRTENIRKASAYGIFVNGTRVSRGQGMILPVNTEFRLSLSGSDSSDSQVMVFKACIWSCRALGKCRMTMHDECLTIDRVVYSNN